MQHLNQKIILDALKLYRDTLPITERFKVGEVDKQIELVTERVDGTKLLHSDGGNWLGSTREWIKCRFLNGSSVTWKSYEMLIGDVSVNDLEELVANCVADAINEFKGTK